MKTFVDFLLSVDVLELIYAFFGAFGGFLLASQWEKFSERKRKKQSISNIIAELNGISGTIEKNIPEEIENASDQDAYKNFFEENLYHFKYLLYYPIWQSLINSGDLLDFKDEPYFDELINLYNRITVLSESINSLPNKYDPDLKDVYYRCHKLCKLTRKLIDEFLNAFDNNK